MFEQLLLQHSLIAVDTAILIYHLEEHPFYSNLTTILLQAVQRGVCHAVLSEISLLELLVLPLRLQLPDVADEYELLLTNFPHLTLIPVSRAIILKAASLRVQYGIKTPDALIIATALTAGATLFVSNDHHLQRITELQVVCLDYYLPKPGEMK